jgi:hypothetical protein
MWILSEFTRKSQKASNREAVGNRIAGAAGEQSTHRLFPSETPGEAPEVSPFA